MQVVRNPLAIGQDSQLASMFAGAGHGQRDSSVACEVAHQFKVAGVEWLGPPRRATAITPKTVASAFSGITIAGRSPTSVERLDRIAESFR